MDLAQGLEIFFSAALYGQPNCSGLNDLTYFDHLFQSVLLDQVGNLQVVGQNIIAVGNEYPFTDAGFEHAGVFQGPQGLAERRPADPQHLGQLALGRQAVPRPQIASGKKAFNLVNNLVSHSFFDNLAKHIYRSLPCGLSGGEKAQPFEIINYGCRLFRRYRGADREHPSGNTA